MAIPGKAWRWGALAGLWTLVGMIVWLVVIRISLILLTPFGTWQRPGIARVTVKWVDRDPMSAFTDNVVVAQRGEERSLSMLKGERAGLRQGDEIWILENYFVTATRPAQFRLKPQRLLLEYPEPLLLLALLGIWRLRRVQARARVREAQEDLVRPRRLVRDEFHAKAERFKAPRDPEGTE